MDVWRVLYIGSAMGAPVESWSMERIAEKYGLPTTFQPHRMYGYPDPYPPGTTEDGTERVKYLCLAIIGKQDRITADDLVKT